MLIHGKLVRLTRPQDEGNGYAMFWVLVTEDIECNDKHQVLCRGGASLWRFPVSRLKWKSYR